MQNDTLNDEYIIQSIRQGNKNGFRKIVIKYQSYIFSIGMRFLKNKDDAYDFVQEVFIKTYNNLDTYKGKAPFRYWIIKIAYNYAINKSEKNKIEPNIADRQLSSSLKTPEEQHIHKETRTILLDAINSLPEKYKICLDFYFFMGLSYNEISTITDFPVNTIKSHVLRAKQQLYQKLKGTIAEEYHDI
jgi:RNA polymerase sigma-70 factor, ECF subfamily